MFRKISHTLIIAMVMGSLFNPRLGWAGSIPPGEAGAKATLDKSPRHHEWAKIAVPGIDL